MSSIMDQLTAIIGSGEVLKDPKEGMYEATVSEVSSQQFNSGALALCLKLTGMVDANGHTFEQNEKIFVPSSEGSTQFKFMFLDTLKTLGLIDQSYEQAITFDEENEQFQQFVGIVAEALEGSVIPLRISRNKNTGYYNARFRRAGKK